MSSWIIEPRGCQWLDARSRGCVWLGIPGRMEWDSTDFIMLRRMAQNSKLMNYLFLEFSI